jgi:hypothetical protein
MKETVLIGFFLIHLSQFLNGQSTDPYLEATTGEYPLQEVLNMYFLDQHVKKIHGRPYENPYPKADIHQFFISRKPLAGVIFTRSDTIQCREMLYDLSRDKVIVYAPAVRLFIELEGAFVKQFSLYDPDGIHVYEFVHPWTGSDSMDIRETGFLQVLYSGERMGLYKRHFKIFTVEIVETHSEIWFKQKDELVLRKGNETHQIKRNRDIFKLYPEDRHVIRKYLRSSGIYVQQASDEQIREIGQFVDTSGMIPEIMESVE